MKKITQNETLTKVKQTSSKTPLVQTKTQVSGSQISQTNSMQKKQEGIPVKKPVKQIQTSSLAVTQNQEQNEDIVLPIQTVKITLKSGKELKNKIKEMELLLKNTNKEFNLNLDTNFASDFEFDNFAQVLQKLLTKVRNLVWVIKGAWTDQGSGRVFRDVFSKCPNLYSLNIEICSSFGNCSAGFLAQTLKQLKGLRILKMFIAVDEQKKDKNKFSEDGNDVLNASLQTLQKLQFLEYNGIGIGVDTSLKNLENCTFEIFDETYCHFSEPPHNYQLQTLLGQRGSKLTRLHIKNDQEIFRFIECHVSSPFPTNYLQFQTIYYSLLEQVVHLPYLTQFKKSFCELNGQPMNDIYYQQSGFVAPDQPEKLIQQITEQRFQAILRIITLKNSLDFIPINPHFLIADLFYN